MNLVFMGTSDFACPSLEAIAADTRHRIAAVVTQPDRPKGRDLKLTASPVKQVAMRHSFPVLQPERAKDPALAQTLLRLAPDVAVVIAYGQILPADILRVPTHGCINVHGSLLPRYRGASPIQSSLLHGETETGVTTMFLDEGLDTGDIILQSRVAIEAADNAQTLHDRLSHTGAVTLLKTLELLAEGKAPRQRQDDSKATLTRKIKKEDGRIDWTLSARELWNRVRAYNPWPTAFCQLPTSRGHKLVKVWAAEALPASDSKPGIVSHVDKEGILVGTGHGSLLIRELQMEGARRLPAHEFASGHDVHAGASFL